MANDINNLTIIGRLTANPKGKTLDSGTELAEFSIASNYYGGKGNDESVSFFDVTFFGKVATVCLNYLEKGSKICITGEIRQQRWKERETGKERGKVVIIGSKLEMLGNKKADSGEAQNNTPPQEEQKPSAAQPNTPPVAEGSDSLDDEISEVPF
jgi:single-strand DNA-binding protein